MQTSGTPQEAGDASKARDQYSALLPVLERVLGQEDPLTLGVRAALARWIGAVRVLSKFSVFTPAVPWWSAVELGDNPLLLAHLLAVCGALS